MSEHTPGPWVQFAIDGKCDGCDADKLVAA